NAPSRAERSDGAAAASPRSDRWRETSPRALRRAFDRDDASRRSSGPPAFSPFRSAFARHFDLASSPHPPSRGASPLGSSVTVALAAAKFASGEYRGVRLDARRAFSSFLDGMTASRRRE